LVARKTGKLWKGGVPNIEAAARIVLKDWNNGKIPYYTPVDGQDDMDMDDE
jgi:nuclear GTP-binding protein